MGLGGRGGGCRSPSLITYCSRLTSRAHESAQLCTCTTLLEQRSSNSGWLWGAGGRVPHQPRRHPHHTQDPARSSLGWSACCPTAPLNKGANSAQRAKEASPRAAQGSRSALPMGKRSSAHRSPQPGRGGGLLSPYYRGGSRPHKGLWTPEALLLPWLQLPPSGGAHMRGSPGCVSPFPGGPGTTAQLRRAGSDWNLSPGPGSRREERVQGEGAIP